MLIAKLDNTRRSKPSLLQPNIVIKPQEIIGVANRKPIFSNSACWGK
jgi:hypothetical protein